MSFAVKGSPSPKGSWRIVGPAGRGRLVSMQGKRAGEWARAAFAAAVEAKEKTYRWDPSAPMRVCVQFVFSRPQSHLTKAGELRKGAPARCTSHARGDLDKLVRLVLDVLEQAGWFNDDSQVVELVASKRYAWTGEATGATVCIDDWTKER